MPFEPEKFFIGLVDFFSILMPGALLAYLGKDWAATQLGRSGFPLDSTEAGMVFLFASYLLGHFAFLFGGLLDERIYDRLRKCTTWGQIVRLAEGENLPGRPLRVLATSLFGKNADAAVMQAHCLKVLALQPLSTSGAINTYQWCKARLSKDHPPGLVAVQRFEADSKFFRSFSVALAVLALFYALRVKTGPAVACAAGIVPALWRYMDQRFKATQQAYWFVITLEGVPISATAHVPAAGQLTHAGGVVCRMNGATVEMLLVQASRNRDEWVLPKGHIEPGEDPRETAVREVREESGHWARVVRWIEDTRLGAEASAPVMRLYLMELVEQAEDWPEENRGQQWLPIEAAIQTATFAETRSLLEKAAALRRTDA